MSERNIFNDYTQLDMLCFRIAAKYIDYCEKTSNDNIDTGFRMFLNELISGLEFNYEALLRARAGEEE